MVINKVEDVKKIQMNKKLNQLYNKKKHKKGENKGVSFSDVLKLVSKVID